MTKGIEDIIHNVLELTKGILESKSHNIPLIMSKRSGKISFVSIIFTNLDLRQTWNTPQLHSAYGQGHSYWE